MHLYCRLGNNHFVDEEDGRSDERDGRPHEDRGPDDGNDLFCSEEDHFGCGSDLRCRKDHGMGDANHHGGGEQDALGRQEDALCPTDRAVRETASAPWQPMLQSDQKRTIFCRGMSGVPTFHNPISLVTISPTSGTAFHCIAQCRREGMLLMIGKTVGHYRIIEKLGSGGMGEVYRADDLKLGQPVALKFLPPKLTEDSVRRERFFAEVQITRQLSHPNICRVYDIGEIDGRHFLSMEFIDGEDLASLIKRIGHLSNEKALDIARQLAAGLAAAHERGVLHRDLKPANIMLDRHGRVRITDFGLAIAAEDETQAAEIAGKNPLWKEKLDTVFRIAFPIKPPLASDQGHYVNFLLTSLDLRMRFYPRLE